MSNKDRRSKLLQNKVSALQSLVSKEDHVDASTQAILSVLQNHMEYIKRVETKPPPEVKVSNEVNLKALDEYLRDRDTVIGNLLQEQRKFTEDILKVVTTTLAKEQKVPEVKVNVPQSEKPNVVVNVPEQKEPEITFNPTINPEIRVIQKDSDLGGIEYISTVSKRDSGGMIGELRTRIEKISKEPI